MGHIYHSGRCSSQDGGEDFFVCDSIDQAQKVIRTSLAAMFSYLKVIQVNYFYKRVERTIFCAPEPTEPNEPIS